MSLLHAHCGAGPCYQRPWQQSQLHGACMHARAPCHAMSAVAVHVTVASFAPNAGMLIDSTEVEDCSQPFCFVSTALCLPCTLSTSACARPCKACLPVRMSHSCSITRTATCSRIRSKHTVFSKDASIRSTHAARLCCTHCASRNVCQRIMTNVQVRQKRCPGH